MTRPTIPPSLSAAAVLTLLVGCASPSAVLGRPPPSRMPSAEETAEPDWTDRLIDPITAPYLFESPLVHSSARPIAIKHRIPRRSVLGGGHAKIYALQLRYALTDRTAIIAVKDGRVDFNPRAAFPNATGDVDVAAGIKHAFIDDPESGTLLTAGLVYEATAGDSRVLQGNGEGAWRPFVTGGWDFGEVNAVAGVGAFLPVDGDAESQFFDYHLHLSYEATERFLPLLEINGLSYTNNGRNLPLKIDGVDYGNLGSTMVDGNDIVTGALGFRYRLGDGIDFGAAWEQPLTDRRDIFDERVMVDLVMRF